MSEKDIPWKFKPCEKCQAISTTPHLTAVPDSYTASSSTQINPDGVALFTRASVFVSAIVACFFTENEKGDAFAQCLPPFKGKPFQSRA
jgi:hypothetical protein